MYGKQAIRSRSTAKRGLNIIQPMPRKATLYINQENPVKFLISVPVVTKAITAEIENGNDEYPRFMMRPKVENVVTEKGYSV